LFLVIHSRLQEKIKVFYYFFSNSQFREVNSTEFRISATCITKICSDFAE